MMSDQNRMSIVVFDGTIDKLYPVAIIASGGLMNDMRVDIFLTFWGLLAFRKGEPYKVSKVSKDYEELAPEMMKMMQEKKVPSWYDTLLQAMELGNIHIYACAMTADLFDLGLDDFEPVIDEIIGVGEFIGMAQESGTTLYI